MKLQLERMPEYVTVVVTILAGIGLAIFSGMAIGRGQVGTVVLLLGAFIATFALIGLRAGVWLLIPLGWELLGTMPITRSPFNVREMSVLFAAGGFAVLYALKAHRIRPKVDAIDLIVWLNVLYLLSVFLRNPVGTQFMNSEVIGGRPYFDALIGLTAFLVLSRAPTNLASLRAMPFVMLAGTVVLAVAALTTRYAPGVAFRLSEVYSGFVADEGLRADLMGGFGRIVELSTGGTTAMRLLTSFYAPITLAFPAYPLRFTLACLAMLAILLSGFRTAVLTAAQYVILSAWFRRQMKDILAIGVASIAFVAILCAGNGQIFNLPLPIQRALSFLPGKWDSRIIADASHSVEWRKEMWEVALVGDKWIKNKLFGDGYGFTKWEFSIMMEADKGPGFIGGSAQEGFLISGLFHHGPLTTIRYVGVVGMVLFVSLMVVLTVRIIGLVRAFRGHPLFPTALFVGMPVILLATSYPFGGGDFRHNFSDMLFAAGLVKLLMRAEKNLRQGSEAPSAPVLPIGTRHASLREGGPKRRPALLRHGN
jgi:hypothetical protein